MTLRNCSYWIFDMDGTLTIPVHNFDDIRRQLGIEIGLPILETIALMPDDQARQVRRRLHEIEMDIAALGRPQPGAVALLEKIVGRGCRIGILTRNDEDIAAETLRASGLDQFFHSDDVVGRETCAPKPQPDGVLHLLSRWQADPAHSVMVGDYLYDIEAGHRAGVRTVHFDSSGEFNWPQYMHHGVTAIADIENLLD